MAATYTWYGEDKRILLTSVVMRLSGHEPGKANTSNHTGDKYRAPVSSTTRNMLADRTRQRSVFAMPTYAVIMSIVAGILDILGVTLLIIKTFDVDN